MVFGEGRGIKNESPPNLMPLILTSKLIVHQVSFKNDY